MLSLSIPLEVCWFRFTRKLKYKCVVWKDWPCWKECLFEIIDRLVFFITRKIMKQLEKYVCISANHGIVFHNSNTNLTIKSKLSICIE